MAATPQFFSTFISGTLQIQTADTSRSLPTAYTAVQFQNLTRILMLKVTALGSTSADVVRVFHHSPPYFSLFEEILIPAVTPSVTVPVATARLFFDDSHLLVIPNGNYLAFTTHVGNQYWISYVGGVY